MKQFVACLLLTLSIAPISSNSISQDDTQKIIYGIIPEDVQTSHQVILTPPIFSADTKHEVCEYKLEPHGEVADRSNFSVPFRVELQDKKTGLAILLVSDSSKLDYEKLNHYEFDVVTVFCDKNLPTTRQELSIRVTDVNEFAPEWKEQGYLVEVTEGKLYDPLIKIAALDKDGSEQFSTICSYKLLTADVPFVLDKKGYLKNTQPLDYNNRHNFILEVVAEDCGGLVSEKVFVNILIKERCKPGWKSMKKEMLYKLPSNGASLLFDRNEAVLETCSESDNCTVEQVTVSLRLTKTNGSTDDAAEEESNDLFASDVDKTCELESRSLDRRLQMCEPDLEAVNLLSAEFVGVVPDEGVKGVTFDGNHAYDVATYKLNDASHGDYLVEDKVIEEGKSDEGKKSVEALVVTRDGPNSKFSVSMWMKRGYKEAFAGEAKRDEKQSVLCSSDGDGMSRSHVSLFLHNCHLVMLARFEPSGRHLVDVLEKTTRPGNPDLNGDEEVSVDTSREMRNEDDEFYQPSEWHWRLDQTCDNKWHHYVVNVEQNKARLFIDGNLFISTHRNPVTLEDHALHLSKKVHSTKLTVGACWKGLTKTYGDHFRGQLVDLRVTRRSVMKETTIKCISNCNEKLDFHSINEMESGMSISMNSQMTELTINGRTKSSVEHLVSTVGYTNPRVKLPSATESSSAVTFQTSVKCADEIYSRPISKATMKIRLVSADEGRVEGQNDTATYDSGPRSSASSSLFISGSQRLDYDEKDFIRGIQVFRDVVIYPYPPERELSYEELVKDNPRTKEIESCTVRVSPTMDEEVEDIVRSRSLPRAKHLRVDSSLEGLVIKGPSKAGDFAEVLRKTYYVHKKPADLNTKIFILYCYDGNGKKSKDELVVKLNSVHFDFPENSQQNPNHIGQDKFLHSVASGPRKGDGLQVEKFVDNEMDVKTGNARVIVTVSVCVCLLMVVIAAGMYRVFFHRQKTVKVHVDNQQDPQWDRSTITITVNPLETATLKEDDPSEKEVTESATILEPASEDYYDDDDDIGSAHEMMGDSEEEEEEEGEEDGGDDNDGGKRKQKYSDEDASKINHFVLSDTE